MPDIRLVQRTDFPYVTEVSSDWLLLADGSLDSTQALASAVIVALGTDRLAGPSDLLPDPDSTDRRGWWGDLDADIWGSWPIGSRLWLLRRSKIVPPGTFQPPTMVLIEQYVAEALQPILDLRIASRLEIEVVRMNKQRIDVLIEVYRGPELAVDLRYQVLWDDITPQGPSYPFVSGLLPAP